jgi:hypothetical protein
MYTLRRAAVAAAILTTLAGCETAKIDGPTESGAPGSVAVAPSYLLEGLTTEEQRILDEVAVELLQLGGGGQAVTGSGTIDFGIQVRRVTVAALRHTDGTFSGRYMIRDDVEGFGVFTVRGEVVCLTILGNKAHVFGRGETGSPTPGLVDVQSVVVTDNGEGGNALPDQVNTYFAGILPENVNPTQCSAPPTGGTDPITQGNFQVRQ